MERERVPGSPRPGGSGAGAFPALRSPSHPDTSTRFDFKKRVAYDADAKRRFHHHARARLLNSPKRSASRPATTICAATKAESPFPAKSRLHADHLYVQASQSAMGPDTGILFRSCEGRRDYTGGRNNFASLDLLHRPDSSPR